MTVTAVVGGQFGSEGKGLIVGHIARDYDTHVRVGAANAGHTLYTNNGEPSNGFGHFVPEKHVMQQLPCAAYANPDAALVIGPGALISTGILLAEVDRLRQWRRDRGLCAPVIRIDPRAHVIGDEQIELEAASSLQERIGSTSATAREGIGQAQADRVMREPRCMQASELFWPVDDNGVVMQRTDELLARTDSILLEGTQGYGLSLTTGDFPYVTSRNTTSAGLCADSAIAPTRLDEVILVCRTYPIRVAGNSGPFHEGSAEIEWESIGVDKETERTTVTKKIRRVATLSVEQIHESARVNGATSIALTFCDYVDPSIAGRSGSAKRRDFWRDHPKVADLVWRIETRGRVEVTRLGTGPHSVLELQ